MDAARRGDAIFRALAAVVLAIADVALAVELQEILEAAGHAVRWEAAMAGAPPATKDGDIDLVVASAADGDLAAVAARWRALSPPPAVLALGGPAARSAARDAHAGFVAIDRAGEVIAEAVRQGLAVRFGQALSGAHARGAIGLPASAAAAEVVTHKDRADLTVIQYALGPHKGAYVTATAEIAALREVRALAIPEVGLTQRLDGTLTVVSALRATELSPAEAARTLWALACVGAVTLTAEPPDDATPERRALRTIRAHLRARHHRLTGATHYDVLEVPPSAEPAAIDHATRSAALRYHPSQFSGLDLGDVRALAQATWTHIEKARAVLLDWASRGRYNDWMAANAGAINTTWAAPGLDPERAAAAFSAGQRALIDGDAFRAVANLALAARSHPHHPDYESTLAWAKYRAEVARGHDGKEALSAGRQAAEAVLSGTRPWPQALTALALLCAASGDPESARVHIQEALRADPTSPAARQILARLSPG